jgi:DNA-binding response OmpR family regulator
MQPAARHILVVEDDEAIRDLLTDVLTDRDYSVTTAASGTAALEAMWARRPDLILLVLLLPDMDGWTFLRLRERERDLAQVPLLVVSAAGPSALREAQELGAPVFLSKPFDVLKLLAEVERLCAQPLRQCAWCGRVVDGAGQFRLRSGRKLRWASHGICPTCKEAERRALSEPPRRRRAPRPS